MIASDIVVGAYTLLGRPSQDDLPYKDVLEHAGDVVNGRLLDMSLIARNRKMMTSDWVTGTDRTMSTSSFGLAGCQFIPVEIEWREVGSDTDLRPKTLQIVAYEQLDAIGQKVSETDGYCAFYNDYQTIAFSNLETAIDARQFRIIFEPLGAPDDAVIVSGAGSDADGHYTYRGTFATKRYYTLIGRINSSTAYAIAWDAPLDSWEILDGSGNTLYQSIAVGSTYPYEDAVNTAWELGNGILPLPTVTLSKSLGITHAVKINNAFLPLCKYETALRCLDQVENMSPAWAEKRERLRSQFVPIFLQEQDRFETFRKTQFGNKKVKKLGFRPRIYV